MGRGLDGFFVILAVALCSFEGPGGRGLSPFPVALARGKHLFPFRTEQLSPSAPMVLGPQGPGRVGRRRFFLNTGRPRAARVVPVADALRGRQRAVPRMPVCAVSVPARGGTRREPMPFVLRPRQSRCARPPSGGRRGRPQRPRRSRPMKSLRARRVGTLAAAADASAESTRVDLLPDERRSASATPKPWASPLYVASCELAQPRQSRRRMQPTGRRRHRSLAPRAVDQPSAICRQRALAADGVGPRPCGACAAADG